MGKHLLLTVRLHGDGHGTARYHGVWQGAPEWPPAPARVFQALVAGGARGNALPDGLLSALEWLESLPPPVIAAPRAHQGERVNFFVPNNDADAVPDPREVSGIRTQKVVHPILLEDSTPILYAWALPDETAHADAIVEGANDVYQLGRGVDMAWATGELVDEETLESRLGKHSGTVHRPEGGAASGKTLACPVPGSLASVLQRHRATKLRVEGTGRAATVLFTNAPKPHFLSVVYERARSPVIYELRDRRDDTKSWAWPLHHVVKLVEALRDSAAERLRGGLPDQRVAIEQVLIGRKADGNNPSPIEHRAHIVPLPSIGHEHVDRAVRRVLIDTPGGAPLRTADLEWAFSGLETASLDTGVVGPFVLIRTEADKMLRHYVGPSRRWRSVTAIALPESAKRRRIDAARQRENAKSGSERIAEEGRAIAAVQVALRHAGIRGTATAVRVQREPFEARGTRAEAFAAGTRFAKERLWHVELELDRAVKGPLVIGDGRFLGLGVLAPVVEPSGKLPQKVDPRGQHEGPVVALPANRSGLLGLMVGDTAKDDPVALAIALRRAVMARVQVELGRVRLSQFFSGHADDGTRAETDHTNHLSFQWDPVRRRLLVIAPHWLDRREPFQEERAAIEILARALEGFVELRAGSAGRFAVRRHSIDADDPLLAPVRSWISATPYAVTRHKKRASAHEALTEDVRAECRRRGLPRPDVTVLDARGVPGRGLEGHLRLVFSVAVTGPVVLGRTRYLGGGLFTPSPPARTATAPIPTPSLRPSV